MLGCCKDDDLTVEYHKMQGVCPLTEELSPSVEELCSVELYVCLSSNSYRCLSHRSITSFLMEVIVENTFRIYCNFQDHFLRTYRQA
jgi:hypothetical protein